MRGCDRVILADPDGRFMLNAMRTAIGLTLGIVVDQCAPFAEWGIYSILLGVFSVQVVMGDRLVSHMLSVLINTLLIGSAVLLGSLCSIPLQVVMVALLAALTLYLFSRRPAMAMVSLFVTLFAIIANGLAQARPPVMGQLIPALLAGGACALIAFLVLPARTSRRYRRRLPRVLLHQLGETCRWLAYLPAVRDFNQLAPALKKGTFNRQATLQRLLSAYHAGCDGGGAPPSPRTAMLMALVEGVITLSYWPVEPLGRDDLRRVNALRRRCFLALASLLCRVESLDYRQRAQRLTALRQWLSTALPEGAHPTLRLLVSLLLALVEQCAPLARPTPQEATCD
ncbi:hypothetical protein [Edwardsiella piscicida]|uniref:hypothetical protein n=1 Tax=Edwardsiella piscicida TaxID=1263550 RepID=UPI000932720F|nr:hypothetical protein [Edwardsiella piscicida]EKS7813971.1 hypothetical protein [Edwardsiella piscicida]WAM44232.1 hypothetical protein NMC32_15235 [Edwardsiella piscicida]